MRLSVRTATIDDLAEIDALLARSYPRLVRAAYPPSVMVTALPLLARAQPRLLRSGTYYAVTGEDGWILGVGGWMPDRVDRSFGHVRHVATDYRAVRQGVGRALMGHVVAEARAAGKGSLESWATLNAVPFYAALGFRELGPIAMELQPGITFPAVRMRMGLAEGPGGD